MPLGDLLSRFGKLVVLESERFEILVCRPAMSCWRTATASGSSAMSFRSAANRSRIAFERASSSSARVCWSAWVTTGWMRRGSFAPSTRALSDFAASFGSSNAILLTTLSYGSTSGCSGSVVPSEFRGFGAGVFGTRATDALCSLLGEQRVHALERSGCLVGLASGLVEIAVARDALLDGRDGLPRSVC